MSQSQRQPGRPQPYAPNPYAPNQPPPPPEYHQGYGEKSAYEGDRFKQRKVLNDPLILIFFILQFAGFCVVSGLALSTWISQDGLGGGVGSGDTGTAASIFRWNTAPTRKLSFLVSHTVYLLLFVAATGLFLSTLYLILVRIFTRLIMHITLVLTILLNIGICIYYYIERYWSGAIIFTVIALLSIFSYFGFRSRIPLAALLLQVIVDVSKHHKSVYAVAFSAVLLQAGLSVWYSFAVIATYAKWTPGSASCDNGTSCSSSTVVGLVFFLTFSYIWTSMTIGNVSLATLAGGPYGCWYYFGPRDQGNMPKHPTLGSLVRASTLSLGSIAFGSLIVTVLEILRLVLNAVRNNANADGQPVEACLACCAECFIGCIEGMVQYFNRYAYIEIALYGKPYVRAATDTWHLFKDRGIDALVNDSLVSMTLTWGAYAVGLTCSLFGYVYLRYTNPTYNAEGQYTAPILLFSFVIGLQLHLTLASAIEAGVSTIFVGLGENPSILAMRAPELFSMIADRYPHVVEGVPRV
ncbi:DUF580-domain-containing protein [Artomyces pyxidatus]|uniref:DUF580-domain-containing protein n=1 Tax=Artomyces pyxidatus TaxID=48021 RepID=A0ACB8T459_9AGAM|nr:DUF580-domain-containing protein [Artomyces pyxidatus]